MNKKKKLKTFVISTNGIYGSRKVLEHIKKNVEKEKVNKSDSEKICEDVNRQINNK